MIAPKRVCVGPFALRGGGQYLLVIRGSLVGERGPGPELWIEAGEADPFFLRATAPSRQVQFPSSAIPERRWE